jgi:hypothetical protein
VFDKSGVQNRQAAVAQTQLARALVELKDGQTFNVFVQSGATTECPHAAC